MGKCHREYPIPSNSAGFHSPFLSFQDLSLLVDLKYEDLQKLQSVGKEAQAEKVKFILKNDLPRVWEHIKTLKDGRVDIVLDNG